MIRVGVNLLWLVPSEVGGSSEYTIRLLRALREAGGGDLEVMLFVNTALASDDGGRALVESYPTVVAPTSGGSRVARVALESTWLRREARHQRVDLMHDAGGLVPLLPAQRTLLTIHDLQPLSMPENFSVLKRSFLRAMVPRSVHAATRVATLSEFVARDAAERFGVDPTRFVPIPPGIRAPRAPTPDELEAVARRYRLLADDGSVRPFFFYPAITYPHKNHVTLVHSFAAVHAEAPETMLVLAGGHAQREADVLAAVERLGLGDDVRRTGRIPWRDVEVLYQVATALTFVSRYEGCGIPALEAMASGCPVIASDCTSIPEIVGEAGVLVGPLDTSAWSAAMLLLLHDGAERGRLIEAGRERARQFDWQASADALAAAYRATATADAA